MVLGPLPDDKPVLPSVDHGGALATMLKHYAPLGVVGVLLFTNGENKHGALSSEMAERTRAVTRLEVRVNSLQDSNAQMGYEFIKLRGANEDIHRLQMEINQLASANNKIRNLEESSRRLAAENASIQRELLSEISRLERLISSMDHQHNPRAENFPYQNDGNYRPYLPQPSTDDDPSLEE